MNAYCWGAGEGQNSFNLSVAAEKYGGEREVAPVNDGVDVMKAFSLELESAQAGYEKQPPTCAAIRHHYNSSNEPERLHGWGKDSKKRYLAFEDNSLPNDILTIKGSHHVQ